MKCGRVPNVLNRDNFRVSFKTMPGLNHFVSIMEISVHIWKETRSLNLYSGFINPRKPSSMGRFHPFFISNKTQSFLIWNALTKLFFLKDKALTGFILLVLSQDTYVREKNFRAFCVSSTNLKIFQSHPTRLNFIQIMPL